MSYLKLTNVQLNDGRKEIVLNLDNIITIYAKLDETTCYIFWSDCATDSMMEQSTGVGLITITGDTYANFAKQVNAAITSSPGGRVIELRTKGKVTNMSKTFDI
jgi:hypothetical protein